jgi:transposase
VSSRERSSADADGARQGAPDAIQVADRVHLRQHLADPLDQGCNTHHHALQAVHEALHQAPETPPDGTVAVPVPPPSPLSTAQTLAHPRRAPRLALDQPSWTLHRQGWPGPVIATPLGIGKHTGCRSLPTTPCPERKPRRDRGRRRLPPSTPDRRERWNAGCRDAWRLFRALPPRGYAGHDVTVAHSAQRVRQAPGQTPRQRRPRHPLPRVTAPPHRALTPRRAPWVVLRRPEPRTPEEAPLLAQLTAQDAERADAMTLAQDLAPLVRQRQPTQLDPGLARAAERPRVPRPRCAKGRRDDDDAVNAGVTRPWSHGPVEGHMNRVKTLTRQRFGRASLELLQRRFVLAASG